MNLLEVQDLKVHFPVQPDWRGRPTAVVRAVDGVSLTVRSGETVGLVGESGCGKSTLGRAIVRLESLTAGSIRFEGHDLASLDAAELRAARRGLQMIFQDPYGSLDPRWTIREIVEEPMLLHGLGGDRDSRRRRVTQLLAQVGLDPAAADRYPHEFSGGQRQRIGIARALAVEPHLIVCDEVVSALDVSVQAQVVNLLASLQKEMGLAYLFIAHDLAVVEHLSHRIVVMYLGRIVEEGTSAQVCRSPVHPYTRALLSAVPSPDPGASREARVRLAGDVPSPLNPPAGCPFHPRCPMAQERCRTEVPELRPMLDGRRVACLLAEE
jgi:oligopeptide/dipeptide ABC transporter ATP-binding protein